MFGQDFSVVIYWWFLLFILGVVNFPATWLLLRRFFDAASLASRKIFFGWPYFAWSAGHDTYKRGTIIKAMLNPTDLSTLCKMLEENDIDYISIINDRRSEDFEVNFDFFEKNFNHVYKNEAENIVLYKVSPTCNSQFI